MNSFMAADLGKMNDQKIVRFITGLLIVLCIFHGIGQSAGGLSSWCGAGPPDYVVMTHAKRAGRRQPAGSHAGGEGQTPPDTAMTPAYLGPLPWRQGDGAGLAASSVALRQETDLAIGKRAGHSIFIKWIFHDSDSLLK
ncbi:hypothetical protein [Burkholderia alba]|uniref:hypothetical protein n=1 Tax=Burkholderia alba TaxID=2683677 RepID=UPI002B05CE63|nr:hypothetical protein [Burkholderia alba]